jgi:nitrogen regulatory protein PII
MYHMVVFVLNDPNTCQCILEAWEAAGAYGITILESSGLGRIRNAGYVSDIPLMASLGDIFKRQEDRHRTLFTVVENQETVDAIIQVTQEAVGDLEEQHIGFLFVVPVSQVYGMSKPPEKE